MSFLPPDLQLLEERPQDVAERRLQSSASKLVPVRRMRLAARAEPCLYEHPLAGTGSASASSGAGPSRSRSTPVGQRSSANAAAADSRTTPASEVRSVMHELRSLGAWATRARPGAMSRIRGEAFSDADEARSLLRDLRNLDVAIAEAGNALPDSSSYVSALRRGSSTGASMQRAPARHGVAGRPNMASFQAEALPSRAVDMSRFASVNHVGPAAAMAPSECSICLATFKIGEQLRLCPCGSAVPHLFHPRCAEQWFRNHHTCPMCRADVSSLLDCRETRRSSD
eukprot:TRINITY_DN59055_c0_g3_i2.p1 TRINITY_DN59055_c0_g3~~TRINITY_DN59055_c0_g3_i2.p1  ORF type:complete len:284 (-),score=36.82 TRINITY_DN59055_c0_g3_i2:29-880(-)